MGDQLRHGVRGPRQAGQAGEAGQTSGQANGGGGEVIVPNGADDDDADMPSDLASRVDALLNPTQ